MILNRVLGGGVILKKEGWLISVRWKTLGKFPTVSIRRAGGQSHLRSDDARLDADRPYRKASYFWEAE